jgi:hypothetical protein
MLYVTSALYIEVPACLENSEVIAYAKDTNKRPKKKIKA